MFRRLTVLTVLFAAACAPAVAPAPMPAPAASPSSSTATAAPAAMPAAMPRTRIAAALDSIFSDTAFASAHWGVLVRSLHTGETLYERNAGRMFVPASNMKIVTAAAALESLGPDFRYRTPIVATGPVQGGTLRGDLVVIGSGDPSISERFFGDVRTVFRAWADSLRAHGVTRITGSVLGDDDVFDEVPLGRGWTWDDVEGSYSAEISGLELNEGFVTVRVAPGARAGAAPRVTLSPATAYAPVQVRATTGGSADITVSRAETGPGLVVSGTVPADTALEEEISIRDNTAFFVAVLREALVQAGISVGGGAREAASGARPRADTLFVHTSPPMSEILAGFMKPSQNQMGEMLLKTMGRHLRGEGTARAGVAVVDSLNRAWGLPARLLSQADGSGLSRYNLVAPAYLVALLEREERGPHAEVFHASLPVAGRDGTLANRMRGTPAEGNVHAKTGTLSGVRSLSGTFTTAAGERMVFSMMVNHHTRSARDADRVAEAALMRLIALPRGSATR